MVKTLRQYTVQADRATGEWIGEPSYVGDVTVQDWKAKQDTAAAHFDTYEVDHEPSDDTTETRAIEVIWID